MFANIAIEISPEKGNAVEPPEHTHFLFAAYRLWYRLSHPPPLSPADCASSQPEDPFGKRTIPYYVAPSGYRIPYVRR